MTSRTAIPRMPSSAVMWRRDEAGGSAEARAGVGPAALVCGASRAVIVTSKRSGPGRGEVADSGRQRAGGTNLSAVDVRPPLIGRVFDPSRPYNQRCPDLVQSRLVGEVAGDAEVEGHAGLLGGGDDLLVADRAAGLDDRLHARLGQHFKAVGEGEERVTGGGAAGSPVTGARD